MMRHMETGLCVTVQPSRQVTLRATKTTTWGLNQIGMGLTGFGVFFLFFGMMLFFDKALLAIGNILFVAGLSFVIGLERTFRFFFQRHKAKATGFFLGGVLVVLIGWPIVGVVLEVYGFFLLFRGFFPVVVGFIRRIPVLGSILNLPFISGVSIRRRQLRPRPPRYAQNSTRTGVFGSSSGVRLLV
ncbi:Vesicle transport protein GOT1B [Merluccius polli]|uniref:Vesicle transport protein GOT1B n=1 Tax=Merluccius polli TaxID=89951 RepID=A0AA47NW94_MERPO|nr:Vesicle transport protein GOT1B [Merluccius polli]